mmetsp:Transcript_32184/g.103934  ORF Transcript_32184/g.103934 Transcript_32184/m.103934 type:complete len:238 (-) Transcript_32184:641-1354(-)
MDSLMMMKASEGLLLKPRDELSVRPMSRHSAHPARRHDSVHKPQLPRLCAPQNLEQVLLDGDANVLQGQVMRAGAEGVLDLDADGVQFEHDEGDSGGDGDGPPFIGRRDGERVRDQPEQHEDALLRQVAKWHRSLGDALAPTQRVHQGLEVRSQHDLPPLERVGRPALSRDLKLLADARLDFVNHHHRKVLKRLFGHGGHNLVVGLALGQVQRGPAGRGPRVRPHHHPTHLVGGQLS